jgi:hypothetical protein
MELQPRDVEVVPEEYIGPCMAALSTDKMRKFAFLLGCGEISAAEAARVAGYSELSNGHHVAGSRMRLRPDIQAAVREVAERVFESCMPLAIASAQAILKNPGHPSHARMIETMLDRTGFGSKSEHKVTVEHRDLTGPAMLARINELAEKFGIGPAKLLLPDLQKANELNEIELKAKEVPRETGEIGESDPAGGAALKGGAGA